MVRQHRRSLAVICHILPLYGFNAAQAESCVSATDTDRVAAAIGKLSDYYDVPALTVCDRRSSRIERLICQKRTLKMMESLDTKSYVYAYENATKNETNHKRPVVDKNWIREVRDRC